MGDKGKEQRLQRTSAWGNTSDNEFYPVPLSKKGKEVLTKSGGEDIASFFSKLDDILQELKKTNLHLSKITDECIEGGEL